MCATTVASNDITKHSAKTHLPRERARETRREKVKATSREKEKGKEVRAGNAAGMDTEQLTVERAKESGGNPTQPNNCRTNWLRESRNQRVTSVDNVVIGLVILNVPEIETQISLLGQMINHFQIAMTVDPSWLLNGLDNLVSILSVNTPSAQLLSQTWNPMTMHSHTISQQIPETTYLPTLTLFLL